MLSHMPMIVRTISAFALVGVAGLLYVAIEFPAEARIVPTPVQLEGSLLRAGVSPESLTAVGVSAATISAEGGIIDDALEYLTAHPSELTNADNALAAARQNHENLQRTIQSGLATPQQASQFPGAVEALNVALINRQDALNDLFEVATENLSTEQRSLLNTIRANDLWEVPIEFHTANRSQAQWVALREGLAHERIALERGEEVEPSIAALLAQARAEPTVAQAIANLQANLQSVTIAWDQAISGE